MNKMHQLGLAMANFASTHNNAFPPAGEIVKTPDSASSIGGYSFLVQLLSFMDNDALYKQLPQAFPTAGKVASAMTAVGSVTPQQASALSMAINTSFKDFVCPTNANPLYQEPETSPPRNALTNYKAVGASCAASLAFASNPRTEPPYGKASLHPDGAIYPSDKNLPSSDVLDGLSHTIFLIETVDDTNSRWMIGSECVLTGLPRSSVPSGDVPSEPYKYFVPKHFDGEFGDSSGVTVHRLRDFLMYDFSPAGPDPAAYALEGDPGGMGLWEVVDPPRITTAGAASIKGPAYGPSSAHPAVVITAFGDGSVQSISKRCDAANFFFLITKNNSDAFNIP